MAIVYVFAGRLPNNELNEKRRILIATVRISLRTSVAWLVLKSFLKTDYRGISAHLTDCPSLVDALGLTAVPHFTTLQKAESRLLTSALAKRLLHATVREHLGRKRRVPRTAIDSTGLESTAAAIEFKSRP